MRRLVRFVLILTFLFAFTAVACIAAVFIITGDDPLSAMRNGRASFAVFMQRDALRTPAGNSIDPVRFEVTPGTSTWQIGQDLYQRGLITDAELFVNYAVAENIAAELEAGTYFLTDTLTIPEIALLLTDSTSSQLPFRILDGWRMEEIADAIDSNGLFGFTGADFLAVVGPGADVPPDFAAYVDLPEGASLEGFLYPDTYLLPPGVTPVGLRDTLLDTFRERVTVRMVNDTIEQSLTIYDIVTLASIAEREAVHPAEYPLIASVYRNRLDEGILLNADPTVQYALSNTRGSWWAQISRADYYDVNSPYNTYLYDGLPPSPIANPDIAAIRAAIYPEDTEYLYFRAACDQSGYHEFALTYEEHLENGCTG